MSCESNYLPYKSYPVVKKKKVHAILSEMVLENKSIFYKWHHLM